MRATAPTAPQTPMTLGSRSRKRNCPLGALSTAPSVFLLIWERTPPRGLLVLRQEYVVPRDGVGEPHHHAAEVELEEAAVDAQPAHLLEVGRQALDGLLDERLVVIDQRRHAVDLFDVLLQRRTDVGEQGGHVGARLVEPADRLPDRSRVGGPP